MDYITSLIILVVILVGGVIVIIAEHKLLVRKKDYRSRVEVEIRTYNELIDHNQRFTDISSDELWTVDNYDIGINTKIIKGFRAKKEYGTK